MAATDTFNHFNDSLAAAVQQAILDLMRESREQLLAARSEDARQRIVDAYIERVNVLTER